jgi:hypothetical protein
MALPIAPPISGILPGPKITKAITIIIINSCNPILGINNPFCFYIANIQYFFKVSFSTNYFFKPLIKIFKLSFTIE